MSLGSPDINREAVFGFGIGAKERVFEKGNKLSSRTSAKVRYDLIMKLIG